MTGGPGENWRSPLSYRDLLLSDRRAFAWEWLRRNRTYRSRWMTRRRSGSEGPERFGLLGWVDPGLSARAARPIWSIDRDPHVLRARLAPYSVPADDLFDVRSVASFVSVEVTAHAEHLLLSDGYWAIRLDLHDGTLLGGALLIEHQLTGLQSLRPKLAALGQLAALAARGDLPRSLVPRERRAAQWILELRVADALLSRVSQQEIARGLYGEAVASNRWRFESAAYRLRIQRLVRRARACLNDPLAGQWFA